MRGKSAWEKLIPCIDGTINIHITEASTRKIKGVEGNFRYIVPYRIGIDFDDFRGKGVHDWIPNLGLSDLVQLINYLELLRKRNFRRALEIGTIPHKFGVELDFRRRLDLDVGKDPGSGNERIEMYYQDPKRFERFKIGWIDLGILPKLIRGLKEAMVEYTHFINKLMILKSNTT